MLLFESLLLLTSSLPRNWRTCPKSSSASTHLRTMAKLPPCVASGICMDGDSSTTPKHPSHQCPPVFRPLDSRLLDHGLTSGDHGYRAVPATDRSRALHPMLATNLFSLPSLQFTHTSLTLSASPARRTLRQAYFQRWVQRMLSVSTGRPMPQWSGYPMLSLNLDRCYKIFLRSVNSHYLIEVCGG